MTADSTRVTLLILTLNEIEGMRTIMPLIKREWYDELIVADGGSTDGTLEFCKEQGYPYFVQAGRGIPLAERQALQRTTGDIIVVFTPDGNSIPDLIPRLVEKLRADDCDMVIASRYLGQAQSFDDDAMTSVGNSVFTRLVNLLFGSRYTDTLVGLRAYKRTAIHEMRLEHQEEENALRKHFFYMNSWELGSCLRAAKLKMKVAEIPGDEPARIGGVRKLSIIKNGTGGLLQILYEFMIGLRFTKWSK